MIRHLYRFPIKGLSAETPEALTLLAGEGIAGDRAVAIARDGERFDPEAPRAMAKTNFLMLMKDEALAQLQTEYRADQNTLLVRKDGELLLTANLNSSDDRDRLAGFFKTYLSDESLNPTPVEAPGHKFTDLSVVSPEKMRAVSLINLTSVRAFEADLRRSVDHRRFRGNICYEGEAPWEEFDWLGKTIRIGGAVAKVVKRTKRCPATEVDPETGARDIQVPFELRRLYGHFDMGIYAEINETGEARLGDPVELL